MTEKTSLAFERPEARSKATSGSDPLDRISVRDFVKEVEIGAFQSERGVHQRVQFNVVLEVSRSAAAKFDDVDQVLSYDTITDAIEHQLAKERINLLETLAERIAEEILSNPRAVRIFVRIEKLDRIPGALGVEIVRTRAFSDKLSVLHPEVKKELDKIAPVVVFLPNEVLRGDDLSDWLDALNDLSKPAIICVEMLDRAPPPTPIPATNRRINLLAIEQNAWTLASRDKRCVVIDSRTELDWAVHHGQISVWAPSRMVLDAVNGAELDPTRPLGLSAWLAGEFGADKVWVLGGTVPAEAQDKFRIVPKPSDIKSEN